MNRALAIVGTGFAVLLAPPIAGALFCLEVPLPGEALALWLGSAALLALSWLVVARRAARAPWIAKACLVVFSLLAAELAARAFLTHLTEWPREKLAGLGRATYPELLAFQPHPFLQFIGQPQRVLRGNQALSIPTPFNENGFPGPALPLAKPAGACRIVCLGASTTIPYPMPMQRWLEAELPGQRFETLNLAHGYYTTANSVVNFVLNAIDYDADYVVLHHGWNDGRAADNAAEFRGDYRHAYKAFAAPSFADWPLLRASVLWRALRWLAGGRAQWEFLDAAVTHPVDPALGRDFDRVAATFERNVRTIVDLALLRGITPVLVTLAHSTDPAAMFAQRQDDLVQFAAVLRAIAASYGERVLFVDLDPELSGRNELFRDVGHMTPAGVQIKAERIGAAILAHWRTR